MHICDFRKFSCRSLKRLLNSHHFNHVLFRLLDGGRFALDVRQYRIDLRNILQDLRFKRSNEPVRFLERAVFFDLDVQLDLQASMMGLDTEIVDRDVVARSHSADAIEDAFGLVSRGMVWITTSAVGNARCTATVAACTSFSVCSKVNRRGKARVRSTK